MTKSLYKIDDEHKHLWDAQEGVVYEIFKENEDYITISRSNKVGLFDKQKNRITIPAIYDSIGGDNPMSIPNANYGYAPNPIEVFLDNRVGLVSPDGEILIEVDVDAEKYILLPATYGEYFVCAYSTEEQMEMHPKICFINSKGCPVTDFIYDSVRQSMRDGKAEVTKGNLVIELDSKLNVIDSYPETFYGFNDEKYSI